MTADPPSALLAEIAALGPWFHNLHLPGGVSTCPDHWLGDFPRFKWRQIAPSLPGDLTGWSCLDIGCNAGFYSFEMARRGATVLGIDVDPHYLAQARWACRRFGLEHRVRFEQMQVYDLAHPPYGSSIHPETRFDLVLFLGVFYHLRYPVLGLDIVAQRTGRLLLFQTLTMPGDEVYPAPPDSGLNERHHLLDPGYPKLAFIEDRFAGDPTNWFLPNHAAVEALLRSAGFQVIARPGHEMYLAQRDPAHPSAMETWNRREYLSALGPSASGGA